LNHFSQKSLFQFDKKRVVSDSNNKSKNTLHLAEDFENQDRLARNTNYSIRKQKTNSNCLVYEKDSMVFDEKS